MKAFGTILLQIIVLELILGGGGRFTAYGSVSLRMILFTIALGYTGYQILKKKELYDQYTRLVLLFGGVILVSVLTGFVSKADSAMVFEDVKPLSFFLILPFFAITISGKDMLDRISNLIIYGSFFLSVVYIITLILVNTGIIPFKTFYAITAPTEELFYRGELAFFYKGFIFLCIGLIFIYFYKPKYSGLLATIIILAIILTFTRGFIFALLLTAFAYIAQKTESLKFKIPGLIVVLLCALIIGFKGNQLYAEFSKMIHKSEVKPTFTREFQPEKLLGDRNFSNNERIKQFDQVLERTTLTSSLIGHGFGIGVPVRPVHMEISYLEIFHKQGLIGLLFWAMIFYILTKKFLRATKKNTQLASAFYFSSLFIFLQSLTNQYFNNPIGMSFILISLVSLDVISKNND